MGGCSPPHLGFFFFGFFGFFWDFLGFFVFFWHLILRLECHPQKNQKKTKKYQKKQKKNQKTKKKNQKKPVATPKLVNWLGFFLVFFGFFWGEHPPKDDSTEIELLSCSDRDVHCFSKARLSAERIVFQIAHCSHPTKNFASEFRLLVLHRPRGKTGPSYHPSLTTILITKGNNRHKIVQKTHFIAGNNSDHSLQFRNILSTAHSQCTATRIFSPRSKFSLLIILSIILCIMFYLPASLME